METVLLLPVILADLLPERRGLGSVDVEGGGGVDGPSGPSACGWGSGSTSP